MKARDMNRNIVNTDLKSPKVCYKMIASSVPGAGFTDCYLLTLGLTLSYGKKGPNLDLKTSPRYGPGR